MMNFNDYEYSFKKGALIFPDGVEYSLREAIEVSKASRITQSELERLHTVKRLFGGEIVSLTKLPGKNRKHSRR